MAVNDSQKEKSALRRRRRWRQLMGAVVCLLVVIGLASVVSGGVRLTATLFDDSELKAEYVLPVLVDQLMHEEGLKVDMLKTDAVWFGVTYKEDKPYVQAELKKMHDAGVYPSHLF